MSTFTAHYIHQWGTYFPDEPLQSPYLPSFDGRAVMYPAVQNMRDYMSWRQVDCMFLPFFFFFPPLYVVANSPGHINNLYNTTFWAMVQQGGMSNTDAEQELQVGTNLIMHLQFAQQSRARYPPTRTRFCSSGSGSTTTTKTQCTRKAASSIGRYGHLGPFVAHANLPCSIN